MSNQSKLEFCRTRIIELVDRVLKRENLREGDRSYSDLEWVKFYVKDLTTECKECEESQDDTPSGPKTGK